MYIKKETQRLLKDLDDNLKLPSRFNQYVEKIKPTHKLIRLGMRGKCHCDNCGNDFIKYGANVRQKTKCPKCKLTLNVRTPRCHHYSERDNFAILDRYDKYYIIRAFEIQTTLVNDEYRSHVCEYRRQIYDEEFNQFTEIEAYNDNISCAINGKFINHSSFMDSNWRINHSYYHTLGNIYKLYPYNLKSLLKGTKWQYSQIWEFAKHYEYFNVREVMHNYNYDFEILVKNKLYNLALDSVDRFSSRLIHKDLYNVIQKHIKFCRRYDLNIDDINILANTNIEDYKFINKYARFIQGDLLNEINVYKAAQLTDLNKENALEYYDYIQMCKKLKYNLKDKKILYPKNIMEEHDKVLRIYDEVKNEIFNKAINDRYKEIIKNKYKNKKFVIFPVEEVNQLIDESSQQNNCVKTYAERIADGKCDIYFMRLINDTNKSLVTVEVRENKIVQKRTKNNNSTTEEQNKFLDMWERKILNHE